MDPRRARHLRDAGDGHFHVGGRDEHQVRQLINDDDDVTQFFGNDDVFLARHDDLFIHFDGKSVRARLDFFLFRCERQFRFLRNKFFIWPCVERGDVAAGAARKNLVAFFHFVDDPAQRK